MIQLLIIADDFTGALDTGVQLALYGAKTRVITNLSAGLNHQGCDVLVVDAETRHLSAEKAYAIVKEIVEQAEQLHIPFLYKKTDSALRGNVGAELDAMLTASGCKRLAFIPAFPQMNRVTTQGVHYINGVPVADSVFGKDPFEPVQHSNVCELIGEQSSLPTHSVSLANPQLDKDGILVFDAASVDALEQIGSLLTENNALHILAGCAGFGAILPHLLGMKEQTTHTLPQLDKRMTVICGSVNPVTTAQMNYAEQNGFARYRLTPEQKLDPGFWQTGRASALISDLQQELVTFPLRILDSNDLDNNRLTSCYAANHNMSIEQVRVGISGALGRIVGELFCNQALGTLMITGGDTLLQCMNVMGVYEVEPIGEMVSGVVLSRFGYRGVTRYVISKSGGFGAATLVCDLAEMLRNQTEE